MSDATHHAAPFDRKFTPVPRQRNRAGGWTADRQFAFIRALSLLPSVAAAARSVGMSARSAWRLRDAPGAEAFVAAWEDAIEMGIQSALDYAVERATIGVTRPIVRRGRVVGHEHRYDNRALLAAVTGGQRLAAGLDRRLRDIENRRYLRAHDARLAEAEREKARRIAAAAAPPAPKPRPRRAPADGPRVRFL